LEYYELRGRTNPDQYRGTMLAHCVNPNCYAPLHSYSEGRLFQFEVVSISIAASDDTSQPFDEKPERQTAHFWLCGRCADSMTLALEPLRGLKVIPLGPGGSEIPELGDVKLPDEEAQQPNSC
jgi:hypothetical protein